MTEKKKKKKKGKKVENDDEKEADEADKEEGITFASKFLECFTMKNVVLNPTSFLFKILT